MRIDQAIYTSMHRAGKDGYHVVSRSRGVTEADARALASWSPSHGGLIIDDANHVSVNIHPLTEGKIALSRTCEGPPEYSGRGGRQIYTHAIVLDPSLFERFDVRPLDLYRNALALGIFRYRRTPESILDELELGRCHRPPDSITQEEWAKEIRSVDLDDLSIRLMSGERIQLRYSGDRVRFAECLMGSLSGELVARLSVSTSLHPSSARPFLLSLTG